MSNVMSQKSLRNNVSRNGFDLSRKNAFTAKVGELLPVMVEEVLPGDKFKINASWFTRTMPVNSAAFTRIKEYYDFFFVPLRLLWRGSDEFFTNMINPNSAINLQDKGRIVNERHPYFSSNYIHTYLRNHKAVETKNNITTPKYPNELGFNRGELSIKLLDYLGYGNFSGNAIYQPSHSSLNPFPLLAYQKIYTDYFRFTNWEEANPSLFNIDYLYPNTAAIAVQDLLESQDTTMFDLRYCNWQKDLFMGLLPSPQYGDIASVISTIESEDMNAEQVSFYNPYVSLHTTPSQGYVTPVNANVRSGNKDAYLFGRDYAGNTLQMDKLTSNQVQFGEVRLEDAKVFNILALRQAEALQKWREISNSGSSDYRSQVSKHFGIDPGPVRSGMCEFIGGSSGVIDISEVVNTNLTNNSDADIAGKGLGSGSKTIDFKASEHGIIMCIYHALPLLDYAVDSMISPLCQKSRFTDYAIPELDKIGMQALPVSYLESNSSGMNGTSLSMLGYAPRYVEYKTSIDKIHGAFRDSLSAWVAPITSGYIRSWRTETKGKISWPFFKCNPAVLDSIFVQAATGDCNTDQLLCNSYFDFKAVRNLDFDGLPY